MQQRLTDQLLNYHPFHPFPHTSHQLFLCDQLYNKIVELVQEKTNKNLTGVIGEHAEVVEFQHGVRGVQGVDIIWHIHVHDGLTKLHYYLTAAREEAETAPLSITAKVSSAERDTPVLAMTNHYPALPAVPSPCQDRRDEAKPSGAVPSLPGVHLALSGS